MWCDGAAVGEAVAVEELVRRLRGIGDPRRDPAAVWRALAGVRPSARSLAPHLRRARAGYRRNRVFRDDRFELLVLLWERGARTPIHGHDGQRCWLLPLAGALAATNYAVVDGGRRPGHAEVAPRERVRLLPGAIDHRDDEDDVHEVAVDGDFAVSLHVYARPIDRCLVYDPAARRCRFSAV